MLPASRLLALAAVVALACGCHVLEHAYDGTKLITPGTVLPQPSHAVSHVDGSQKAYFLFFGLVPLNRRSASGPRLVERLAYDDVGNYYGVTQVRIRERAAPLDVIASVLTLGLFSMMTVEVEGEVHLKDGSA